MVVLVIDDTAEIRALVLDLLSDEGYTVAAVPNGQEALIYLRRATRLPCLILLDLHMPIMNAWDFRAAQLLDPRLAHIPVMLYSAARDLEEMAIELGAVRAIPKTIDIEEILAVVRQYCRPGDTEAGAP